jgi:hypothetical protein
VHFYPGFASEPSANVWESDLAPQQFIEGSSSVHSDVSANTSCVREHRHTARRPRRRHLWEINNEPGQV